MKRVFYFVELLVALVCMALSPAAFGQSVPSIFGLSFSERLDLPYCAGGGKYQPKKGMCISHQLGGKAKPYTGPAKIIVACCDMPSWVSHSMVLVELVDSRMERMFIITEGVGQQQNALAALTAKFGKPATSTPKTMQNGYGAQYGAIDATWVSATVDVNFFGAVEGTNNGAVTIATPAGRAAYAARSDREPNTKLKF